MFNKKAMAQWRQVNGNQSVPIERFLELASGNQQTQPQQPQQQQQSTQPATQNALQTAQQHVAPTAQSQQLVNTMNRNQIQQQQLGSSSTTPIVITSTNSNIAQNTLITQPTSLFIVVSLFFWI
jgi:hypothetical protein